MTAEIWAALAAGVSALISIPAAIIASSQARSSKRQVHLAQEAARAARDSADVAKEQLALARQQWRDSREQRTKQERRDAIAEMERFESLIVELMGAASQVADEASRRKFPLESTVLRYLKAHESLQGHFVSAFSSIKKYPPASQLNEFQRCLGQFLDAVGGFLRAERSKVLIDNASRDRIRECSNSLSIKRQELTSARVRWMLTDPAGEGPSREHR